MKRGIATALVAVFLAAPAAHAATPSVGFKRPTYVRTASGFRPAKIPRGRTLQFDVRYVVRNVPARWKRATAQITVRLARRSDVLTFSTRRASTETGVWRWVVTGRGVKIPTTYPAGRYTIRVRIVIRHGATSVASTSRTWRATVR